MISNFLKIIFLFFFFWLLAVLEASFFSAIGKHIYIVWITVAIINIFENRYSFFGLWAAVFGGFFLDIYNHLYFFGFNILILTVLAFIFKFILLRYVELPISQKPKKF